MNYDNWKSSAPERDDDPVEPCPICTGHRDAEPCSEECAELVARTARTQLAANCYRAAHMTIKVARAYRRHGDNASSARVVACIEQARKWRAQARVARGAA